MNIDKPLSEIFVEEGFVTREELNEILAHREDTTEPLGSLLVRLKKITEKQKLQCMGIQMGVPFVDLAKTELDVNAANIISHSVAVRLLVFPVEVTEVSASVAMVDPLNLSALDELTNLTGRDIDPLIATETDIRESIFRAFGAYDDLGEILGEAVRGVDTDSVKLQGAEEEDQDPVNVVDLKEVGDGAPVVKLANALLVRAIGMRASDIHIEPFQRKVRVRVRIDGLLQEIMVVPKDLQLPLASRIKLMAGLDIAERRAPQDGRCTLVAPQGEFDFRVSTYPSVFGETLVIRILDKNAAMINLSRLGIHKSGMKTLISKLEEPQGLILVTGPTGSGKTTTLYAALHHLNSIYRNIITIEDPVEYQMEGITQASLNVRAGVSFATGLRAMLRQDPDVILVGEIRDADTASIATEAALTGHLVLSSLHANDASSSITRLLDMGVEPFLLGGSITCAVAQRLVRTNCTKCLEEYKPDPENIRRLGLEVQANYVRGRGCEHCSKTGYRGRVGIYECLDMNSELRRMILSGRHASEIQKAAVNAGMLTLRQDAADKVLEGRTTVEEVLRVTAEHV
ncbi:MAG: type II/IV secretion system protein [Armatimonadetes bacterium]|nr:type II secretion system protein GspE [Armatimonadota bacterium]MBS1700897.1 type II/IV secretion system protein [Armatimonadota bacterium]